MELETFVKILAASRRKLDEAIDELDDETLSGAAVVEAWSVKDLLGHVATWEQVAVRLLEQFEAGAPLEGVYGSAVDAYNAAESQRHAALSLAEIRAELASTREQLDVRLATLGADAWGAVVGEDGERFGDWLGGTLGGDLGPGTHDAEHAHQILLWRVRR